MQVNMFDAKSRLSQLVQAVLDGEEVILARNGEPVAQITRYRPTVAQRKPGALRGVIGMSRDWDSAKTNREIAAQLEATPVEPQATRAFEARQPRARYRAARPAAVRLLLDTHFVLWWLAGNSKLGPSARRLIAAADCAVSTASFIEMRMKCAAGKLSLPPVAQLHAQLDEEGFQILALTPAHVEASARFEQAHPDALDRLLLGTAAVEGRALLTRDAAVLALAGRAKLAFVREG